MWESWRDYHNSPILTPNKRDVNVIHSLQRWIICGVFCFAAHGQVVEAGGGGPGAGGGVSNVATGCGMAGGPITTTGTVRASQTVNAQTGTTYTVVDGDCGKIITHSNASAIAVTLPNAAGAGFDAGWFTDVQNLGSGTVTITPTTSTIDGAATLVLLAGQGSRIVSDGTNYFTQRGIAWHTVGTAGVSCSDSGNITTCSADSSVASKANIQNGSILTCNPSSGSGTAYSGCGSMSPTLTTYSLGGPIFFKPDVVSGASPTFDPDGAASLVAKNMQKLRYGALTNIAANDLDPDSLYLMWYRSTADVYVVVPMESRFDEDGSYFYTRLGSSGGAGVFVRQLKGGNTVDFRRDDNAAYATVNLGTIRGKNTSDLDLFEYNPTQSAGAKAYFWSTATTGDFPEKGLYQNIVQTTNATVTTLLTIPITNNRTTLIRANITAECESGAGCTANDGAGFQLMCTYRAAAGTATEIGDAVSPTAQSDASLTLTVDCSPSTGNALVRVTGEASSTIRWTATAEVYQ